MTKQCTKFHLMVIWHCNCSDLKSSGFTRDTIVWISRFLIIFNEKCAVDDDDDDDDARQLFSSFLSCVGIWSFTPTPSNVGTVAQQNYTTRPISCKMKHTRNDFRSQIVPFVMYYHESGHFFLEFIFHKIFFLNSVFLKALILGFGVRFVWYEFKYHAECFGWWQIILHI